MFLSKPRDQLQTNLAQIIHGRSDTSLFKVSSRLFPRRDDKTLATVH